MLAKQDTCKVVRREEGHIRCEWQATELFEKMAEGGVGISQPQLIAGFKVGPYVIEPVLSWISNR